MSVLECPVHRQLYDYWATKRGPRVAPARADLLPEELRGILPHIVLIDVIGPPQRFRYRLVGTAFFDVYGREITGKFVDEIDVDDKSDFNLADYAKVARDKAPSLCFWEYTKRDGRCVRYGRLLLPLSANGADIDMMIGAVTTA